MTLHHLAQPGWRIQIYSVRDCLSQQRILSAIHRIDSPGVVALGTQSGPDWFVIVECSSLVDQIRAHRIVTTIDPRAVRTYDHRSSPGDTHTRAAVEFEKN